MHEVLVNRLGGLSLPRKSVVRLTDRPDMTLDAYRGRKTTKQQKKSFKLLSHEVLLEECFAMDTLIKCFVSLISVNFLNFSRLFIFA